MFVSPLTSGTLFLVWFCKVIYYLITFSTNALFLMKIRTLTTNVLLFNVHG